MLPIFNNDWDNIMSGEFDKEYFLTLKAFLEEEYKTYDIYPNKEDVFNAMKHTPYKDVKCVILGQDPYHEPNQAHGLCFSVKKGCSLPPSLKNIFKELHADLGVPIAECGELYSWADNGVLLLNTVLTVRKGQANSHKGKGWEIFTDNVIKKLNEHEKPIVFILWGGNARSKKKLITATNHFIIESAHPSPLSAYNGFWNSKPFSKANDFLISQGIEPVNWNLTT